MAINTEIVDNQHVFTDNQRMEADAQIIIGKLEERKRKLLEELAEVEFHLAAAIKYTKKRNYNPEQLAAARAKKGNQEESGS